MGSYKHTQFTNVFGLVNIILGYKYTSVTCVNGPSVNPLQNRGTQHVNIVLQCTYQFFEQPSMKGKHA
jgi:hypothetical protein